MKKQVPIQTEHFDEAKKVIPPSLPDNLVEHYKRKINELMGD